jgi:ferredoxin
MQCALAWSLLPGDEPGTFFWISRVNHDDAGRTFRVTLLTPEGEKTITVGADEHIWDAAWRQGVKLPALCHQGWCLTCAGRVVGGGEFDQRDSREFYAADRQNGFVLPCTARACSDLVIRTHQATELRKFRLRKGLPSPYSDGLIVE